MTSLGQRGKKNVVVFAGAGASKAVCQGAYPTTVEYFEQLPSEVTDQGFFSLTLSFAKKKAEKTGVVDVEVMLWHLMDLENLLRRAVNTQDLLGWYLDGSRLTEPLHKRTDFGNVKQAAQEALPKIRSLVASINQNVYRLYQRLPSKAELEGCWLPLLRDLAMADFRVELVTTNYDLILEAVIDEISASTNLRGDAGWRGSISRELELDLWASGKPFSSDLGLLTKLHGSINWSRGGNRIYVSDPEFKGNDERHAIIYPGFKGRPSLPPFDVMHTYFAQSLLEADAAVFIGFAFRDEYINDLVGRYLRRDAPIVILNPAKVHGVLGRSAEIHHVDSHFSVESANDVASWLAGRRSAS